MENICIPMHMDAFALSPASCDGLSKIAPYTQPNYTALRLDNHLIQHDVLDYTDFHNTSPATKNPRLADLGVNPPDNLKRNRMGIHLHWALPRFYRAAQASGATPKSKDPAAKQPTDSSVDKQNPKFPLAPNRWLVTRQLMTPQPPTGLKTFQSWVVESNVIRKVTAITDDSVDLESDVAPFVHYEGSSKAGNVLNAQTENFLGQKFDLIGYDKAPARGYTELTVMNSSNPLFPDYALHNTNVFSTIDNFGYKLNPNDPNEAIKYLDDAECNYFVIGWHHDPKADPLSASTGSDLSTRLKDLKLQLTAAADSKIGTLEDPTRCLLFGAIYNAKFNIKKTPKTVLADKCASKFLPPFKMEPLSVGTTPLDSMLAFLEAHEGDGDSFFVDGKQLAKEIMEMSQFLYAAGDEYDARVQAQDLIAQQNFAKADGGLIWTFAKPPSNGGTPAVPNKEEAGTLRDLNEYQAKRDVCNRKARSLRWELFAEWWKFTSEYIPLKTQAKREGVYMDNVTNILKELRGSDKKSGVLGMIEFLNCKIDDLKGQAPVLPVKSAAQDPFYTRSDPTLCIAGIDSGWPVDFLSPLTVTTDSELADDDGTAGKAFAGASNPVPNLHDLDTTVKKLFAQFSKNSKTDNGLNSLPLTTGFQAWGDQNPFAPLFIEWEAVYYHIAFDKWEVKVRPSPVGHAHSQVRYVPKIKLADSTHSNCKDFRIVDGRVLILPQPVFSLQNTILQLIQNQPPGLSDVISKADQNDLSTNIQNIKFISATLSGLTDHLLTRCEGAHVKPLVRIQGGSNTPLDVAAAVTSHIGIDCEELKLVEGQSAVTPYGNLMAFGRDLYPERPFKGVTHGQMVFTKLNIIDKFGQAISLPVSQELKPRRRQQSTDSPAVDIYPCLSDYLAPDVDGKTGVLNTVYPTADAKVPNQWPLCEFMQLTPAINQDARINASFLTRDSVSTDWREATEYEQPIWGWIVINYADGGLQFFRPDGVFYQEVRMGGVTATNLSKKWLPGDPPKFDVNDPPMAQLKGLIDQLSPDVGEDDTFLQAFFDMINGSIQNMPFPPSDYSGYANAIVGKPLALVNVGWSIEMAAPAIRPQNTLPMDPKTQEPDIPTEQDTQAALEAYSFPLKIGDLERTFDGVVGYYLAKSDALRTIDFSTPLYSYFVPNPSTKIQEIDPTNFPALNPYYIQPDLSSDMTNARTSKYTVTSLLIDPYTPLHGYSPILPTKTLKLPPWTIQTAMQNMHAFFHLGPNLVTTDVPKTYDAALAFREAAQPFKFPASGRKGTWQWLQPYAQDGVDQDEKFVALDVQEDLGQTKFEAAPYTFLEGYLQLMGSLKATGK